MAWLTFALNELKSCFSFNSTAGNHKIVITTAANGADDIYLTGFNVSEVVSTLTAEQFSITQLTVTETQTQLLPDVYSLSNLSVMASNYKDLVKISSLEVNYEQTVVSCPSDGKNGYKYGFNGKEMSNEISEGDYDFGARIYDSRLGRWMSRDPKFRKFPYESNYAFVSNNPMIYVDWDGSTKYFIVNTYDEVTGERTTIRIVVNDDLQKGRVWHKRNSTDDDYYNIGWYDINVVQNITLKKDGTIVREPLQITNGKLRYEQHPFWDLVGYNSTQEAVNNTLTNNPTWGG